MTAETKRKTNWWLVAGGAVLVIFGCAIFAAPGVFLGFLTVWAGVGFIFSAATGIASYLQVRKYQDGAGWSLLMAVLDLVVGVLLILHPFAFAAVIPWLLGVAFIVFGILQVAGMMPFSRLVPEIRTIAIISGILCILVGVMFIVWPASLSIWVAAFALVRGITLIALGFTARS